MDIDEILQDKLFEKEEKEATKADDNMQELLNFKNDSLSLKFKFQVFKKIFKSASSLITQSSSLVLVTTIGFFIMKFTKNVQIQSAYSFVALFYNLIFLLPLIAFSEPLGIKCSENFGAKE